MSQYVLPPLLALFNRHYPEIRIRLKSGNTEEIEQAVQDEAVQLGIVGRHRKAYGPALPALHGG